ncbi:hypothetical protein PIB30_039165 [Stylosanthes scabra]|uniref:Uncharacterized protein n=1 Tax=Stylosanthes scabra TaxID=79078 RepID=A0ABU6WCC5_9FABA|nr:hypothetical protein [Stylosanthes scabra]
MTEGTCLNRLEEMTLSNKHEVVTLSRGQIEANERIAETQLQLHTIEQLMCDSLKGKTRTEPMSNPEHSFSNSGPFNSPGENNCPWKLKVVDLPMCDGEGIKDWIF